MQQQRLSYTGPESKKKKQFPVNDVDTPVTLKQGRGHQTWHELIDPKQGYNHAKFGGPHLNSVRKKANVNVLSDQKIRQLSPLKMCHILK